MPLDRFMIAPLQGGLENNLKPWMITDDSFSRLNNAYIFRGRVRKRFGARLMNSGVAQSVAQLFSRLRISLGNNTNAAMNLPANTTSHTPQLAIGQMFSLGSDMFTVYQLGAGVATLTTNPAVTATINSTVNPNTITFTGGAASPVFWYPALPVMGLFLYQTTDSLSDPTYAFDTEFAYVYTAGAWTRLGTAVWTGTDSQFFWAWTWQGATPDIRYFVVVNNNPPDQIKYWDGATWTTINPAINAGGDTLETALILVAFKNHLIALNTVEKIGGNNIRFTNRARYAAFGDFTAATSWRQDIPGKGNSIDAATMEDIVSCEFIKDRLIVFFERSTWELAFTGNQAQPFTWQQINTELGAESTWSIVPFDKITLGIGNTGIHACNGSNVERIDDKIPNTVWNIHTGSTSSARVYGIRDYYAEQVYWTFPNEDTSSFSSTYPTRILVYNYKTGSWAFNDDSITAFGYFYAATQSAITWDSLDVTWDDTTVTWDSGVTQPLNQDVLAGNQEGFVFIIDINQTMNAPALQITNITLDGSNNVTLNVINHNLSVSTPDNDYVYIQFLNGLTGPFVSIYPIISITDANNFIIMAPDIQAALLLGQVYTGGGTITRISRIDIFTKQFNFYVKEDRNAMIQRVDCLVERTDSGEITLDYATSTANPEADGLIAASLATNTIQGTSILETFPYALYPLEQQQDRIWHPVYLWADGECIQLRIYFSDQEMANFNISTANFELHAMTFYTQRTAARLQ